MKYPALAKELINLLFADQEELRSYAKIVHAGGETMPEDLQRLEPVLREHTKKRSERALEILNQIQKPTISAIGTRGSEALAVLALHADRQVMEKIYHAFSESFKNNPADTYLSVIPALMDRLLILERQNQRFGTQWLQGADGTPFLYPVDNFERMNERRADYGLGPLQKPRMLALENPHGSYRSQPASYEDMRQPSEKEYQAYAGEFS